jgi:hypothetical protein
VAHQRDVANPVGGVFLHDRSQTSKCRGADAAPAG